MSLRYAVLGLLSHEAKTGYELKKIMQDSPFLYWSASNNQIYSMLMELKEDGYVRSETLIQERAPSKKRYTITPEGLLALREWAQSPPEPPTSKKAFLVQLACADQLSNKELSALLDAYESTVRASAALENKAIERGLYEPARSPRERVIWKHIYRSGVASLESELLWIQGLKQALQNTDCAAYEHISEEKPAKEESNTMLPHHVVGRYIAVLPGGKLIQSEQDALDLVGLCFGAGVNALLIPDEAIADEFFRLRTGLAGAVLQKFRNYNIKAAIVVHKHEMSVRFQELAGELNNGGFFRVFDNAQAAEAWVADAAEV